VRESPVETAPRVQASTAAKKKGRPKSAMRELIETVALTALVFLAIRAVAQNYQVDGHSMDPTMHNGEFVIVLKADYWFQKPQTGDIIVLQYPEDPSRNFIKRVIGTPGDTVAVNNGHVFINGHALNEPYILQAPAYTVAPLKVPAGKYWVLGDNRNNSNDSHIWGFLPANEVIGKAWAVYWPPALWRLVPHAHYGNTLAPAPTPAGVKG
jgi:signal peptidase I